MGNSGRMVESTISKTLIKSIIQVINPKIGETIYDGAVGSAGFLIEAYDYINKSKSLTTSELKILQKYILWNRKNIISLRNGFNEYDTSWD